MKLAGKNPRIPWALVSVALLLVLGGYNYWSYRCGYCTLSSLMSLSAPAILLLFVNLMVLFLLFGVRLRNRRHLQRLSCDCGAALRSGWGYCPDCGKKRS